MIIHNRLFNPVIPTLHFNYRRDIRPVGTVHVPRIILPITAFKLEVRWCAYRKQAMFILKGRRKK